MNLGIVGNEEAKFNEITEAAAKQLIRNLLEPEGTVLVSGHCHLGGIDIWSEEIADELGREKIIFPPKVLKWEEGFKPRNIQIAKTSAVVANITVTDYPESFTGKRYKTCYHCINSKRWTHVKSGGCWTAKYAMSLNKKAIWYVIRPDGALLTSIGQK